MEYFSTDSRVTKLEAYMYALGVVGMSALYTFTHHPYFFGVMRTGMRIRIACCALLYRKVQKSNYFFFICRLLIDEKVQK